MTDIRAGFDVLFDKLETRLKAYATEQAALDVKLGYTVLADYTRKLSPNDSGAYVSLWVGNVNPQTRRSAGFVHYEYEVSYQIEALVLSRGVLQGEQYAFASARAGVRLRYLVQQIMTALNPAIDADFGMPRGSVGSVSMPRIEFLAPDAQENERPMAAAILTMDFSLVWEPTRQQGIDLESIAVNAGLWSALFDYGEDEE